MTSWKKRIRNCERVVKSILNQSMKPDLVFLNLSLAEFPRKNIPEELIRLEKKNPTFKINWVPGRNTKTMKKVFPILPLIDDNDLIMTLDDDTIYHKDLLKSSCEDFMRYGGTCCITRS